MQRPEWIARQARCPTGLVGKILGRIMAVETSPENEQALQLLGLHSDSHVLDVGCGHGRTLARAAASVPDGFVAGVDVSAAMVRMASRHNRELIKNGRVEVTCTDSTHLPYPEHRFDSVLSVHTLYFWSNPDAHLREIHRVMKDGARFVLGCRSAADTRITAQFPASIYRFYTPEEAIALLTEAGFQTVTAEQHQVSSGHILFISGQK